MAWIDNLKISEEQRKKYGKSLADCLPTSRIHEMFTNKLADRLKVDLDSELNKSFLEALQVKPKPDKMIVISTPDGDDSFFESLYDGTTSNTVATTEASILSREALKHMTDAMDSMRDPAQNFQQEYQAQWEQKPMMGQRFPDGFNNEELDIRRYEFELFALEINSYRFKMKLPKHIDFRHLFRYCNIVFNMTKSNCFKYRYAGVSEDSKFSEITDRTFKRDFVNAKYNWKEVHNDYVNLIREYMSRLASLPSPFKKGYELK